MTKLPKPFAIADVPDGYNGHRMKVDLFLIDGSIIAKNILFSVQYKISDYKFVTIAEALWMIKNHPTMRDVIKITREVI